MKISKTEFAKYINEFRFKGLFLNLGWDNDRTPVPLVQIGGSIFEPHIVADKNGFKIIECKTSAIPSYAIRIQVANTLKKLFHEHLLIFYDEKKSEQVWLYCYTLTSQNKKAELRFSIGQDVERLYQRASGLIFELDEQDNITIIDVTARVRGNFAANAERVTKRFYDAFKKQHTALLGFIKGIQLTVDKEWYASIMLNRLMFCYFMQRRGFLDKDRNYLRTKLNESKERFGKDKFYSFYRDFLLVLFQKGFGSWNHDSAIKEMIGEVPYLNGGLFDLHEIERNYPGIDISDDAFENIFDLFDRYEWHLDTRDCATGNEINPDVLGYIFEKYINDRSSMGAYYTQEDITGYISRSTILPWLLEKTKKSCPKLFEPDSAVWSFLKNSGDTYIFESVKHGVGKSLPEYIAIGQDTEAPDLLERRKRWNELAPADFALPTEIWREVVERRTRYEKVKNLIASGHIHDAADFITYNLDIISFITDLLDTVEAPKFIQAFYAGLERITILDPTCGSGAFLFAALNILEPLYDSCLSRMDDYLNHDYKGSLDRSIKRFFDEKLEQMGNDIHPSKHYFIYKSIILNNLYGVDIMREAVETAKLRLFLKLVSTVDPDYTRENIGIEPLPDIDFNVKAGNTLIGYANEQEVDKALVILTTMAMRGNTKDAMLQMAKATARYKQLQLGAGDYRADDFRQAKEDLSKRQTELKNTLDALLRKFDYRSVSDEDWNANYMSFHWVSEFFTIIVEYGGFDVIIGNPPYVEYAAIKNLYSIKNYTTLSSGNLYAFIIERSITILRNQAYCGMIIPLSAYCTERMTALQKIQIDNCCKQWISFYAERPSKLFDGVDRNLAIVLSKFSKEHPTIYTTTYKKWNSESRYVLFNLNEYYISIGIVHNSIIPKIGNFLCQSILKKVEQTKKSIEHFITQSSKYILYYRNTGGRYWKITTSFRPFFSINGEIGSSSRESHLYFDDETKLYIATAIFNSNIYYWYYTITSNARDNNPSDLKRFPIDFDKISNVISELLFEYAKMLMSDYNKNAITKTERRRTGIVEFQQYNPKLSKSIIDKIDITLAKYYGLTEEELDYIINYDIKYRMGISGNGSDDDE
jgi:hypothetical protein